MTEPPAPPFVPSYGLSSSSGTWDDWLAMRPEPGSAPRENSADITTPADGVAIALVRGGWEVLDFGFELVRDGMRDLFAEFEASVKGQTVLMRKIPATPKLEITVERTNEDLVRITMALDSGQSLAAADFGTDEAFQVAASIVTVIKAITGEED